MAWPPVIQSAINHQKTTSMRDLTKIFGKPFFLPYKAEIFRSLEKIYFPIPGRTVTNAPKADIAETLFKCCFGCFFIACKTVTA